MTTDWKKPTLANNTVDSGAATNFDNALLDDGNYVAYNSVNDQAEFGNFGNFGLPANAIIRGIEIRVEGKYTGAGINRDVQFYVKQGNSFWAGDNSDYIPSSTSDDVQVLGGTTNLWATTGWTVAHFADGSFKVKTTVNSLSVTSVDIDYFEVRVSYDLPPTIGSLLQMFQ